MKNEANKNKNNELFNYEGAVKKLCCIPSIGPKVGMMLAEIGISEVLDLKNRSPEALYENICRHRGEVLDRCVLYHFKCAVYFASNDTHKPELLKWWNWK